MIDARTMRESSAISTRALFWFSVAGRLSLGTISAARFGNAADRALQVRVKYAFDCTVPTSVCTVDTRCARVAKPSG